MNDLISLNSISSKWRLINIDEVVERTGILRVAEFQKHFEFKAERFFFLSDILENEERGYHAHKELKQLVICLAGSYTIQLDDGYNKQTIKMTKGRQALLLDGLVWRTMYEFTSDALMLVLCDRIYANDEVIRDYELFKKEVFINEL